MSTLNKTPLILIAIFLTFGLLAAAVQPAAAAVNCTQWHTVSRGEYLVQIARLYGTSWRSLAEINNLDNPSRVYPGQKLCISVSTTSGVSTPAAPSATSNGVRVYAVSVEEDRSVTLRGSSLIANTRYSIRMSPYGNRHISPILTGSVLTDKNGAFTALISIPKSLVDVAKIAVRIDSGGGDTASNWFLNATADSYTGGEGMPSLSFSVVAVREDDWVKIKTTNLPPNVTFNVLMGKSGSKGVNGVQVGTLRDDEGGSLRAAFEIPSELEGKSKIDIRLESKLLGIYYYTTFDNENAP